jgi:uncharacterized damage-inducible protein DinB
MADNQPEIWLRGPLPGVPALLQPVAHALLQARNEVADALTNFPDDRLWERPAGVASVGFHLQHLSGVLDRLLTYARVESLTDSQLAYLKAEGQPNDSLTVGGLLVSFDQRIEQTLAQLKSTAPPTLTDFRAVGGAGLPSTVLGLLFHAAEHTQRHTGQLLVTVRVVLS